MPATPGEIMPVVGQTLFPMESRLTLSGIIIGPTIVVGLQFLVYGFYILSFTLCLIVLKQRPKTRERTFHLHDDYRPGAIFTSGLGVVQKDHPKTIDMIKHLLPAFRIPSTILTMMANILADVVLVFRCYAIFNFQKAIIIIPAISCVLSNALGIISMAITVSDGLTPGSPLAKWIDKATYLENTYFILNALINVVLTSMVAGKIWLSSSQPDDYISPKSKKRYASIASIIFQSGLLYPLILVVSVPFTLLPPLAGWDLYPLLIQFAGICPTLMIARVGLGDNQVKEIATPPPGTTPFFSPRSPRSVISIVDLDLGKSRDTLPIARSQNTQVQKSWVIRRK
ncbi:hypothetical protein PM082_018611 [Marasmius tenuissimus]|nr:hypothetical protein PM082_018611 [Marasmius tenuissimus]